MSSTILVRLARSFQYENQRYQASNTNSQYPEGIYIAEDAGLLVERLRHLSQCFVGGLRSWEAHRAEAAGDARELLFEERIRVIGVRAHIRPLNLRLAELKGIEDGHADSAADIPREIRET